MKKSEIKVGEEYAAGNSSRYDRWQRAHVRVLSRGRGILVEFVEDSNVYRFRAKAGEQRVLNTARDIIMPWADYVEGKRAYDEAQVARAAKVAHVDQVAKDVVETLKGYAIYDGSGDYRYNAREQVFIFRPERLAELLRIVERRKAV